MDTQVNHIITAAMHDLCSSLIIADTKGLTIYVSPGFTKATGFTIEDMLNKTPGQLLQGPATEPESVREISRCLGALKPVSNLKITNYKKNGQMLVFILDIQPVFDSGALIGFLAVQQDITDIDKQATYSQRITDTLLSEIENKNTLIRLLRHDVRDSLGCIISLDSIGELDRTFTIRSVNSCLRVIDSYDYVSPTVNIYNMVNNIVDDISYRAERKGIVINNAVPAEYNIRINGKLLFIILRNFIINAIKFSNPDSVVLVSIVSSVGKNSISVQDWGIGMSADLVSYLLRGEGPLQSNGDIRSGMRASFILCRKLLELNGYAVTINSQLGGGTQILIGPL